MLCKSDAVCPLEWSGFEPDLVLRKLDGLASLWMPNERELKLDENPDDTAWSHGAPNGWTIDNSQMLIGGVTESRRMTILMIKVRSFPI